MPPLEPLKVPVPLLKKVAPWVRKIFQPLLNVLATLGLNVGGKALAGTAAKKTAWLIISTTIITIFLYVLGWLPRSPFQLATNFLLTMQAGIPVLRYLPVFLPVVEIMAVTYAWVIAVGNWYLVKKVLKKLKILK